MVVGGGGGGGGVTGHNVFPVRFGFYHRTRFVFNKCH